MSEQYTNAMPVEQMTLSNVAEGELEDLFQEEIANALEILGESAKYVHDKDGNLRVRIMLNVDLILNKEAGSSLVDVSSDLKRPKRMSKVRAAYLRNGKALVDKPRQEPLPLDNVRPISGKKEE